MPKYQAFLEISIAGSINGRVTFDLYDDLAPRTVENFMALCQGTTNIDPVTNSPLTYKGCKFFRVVPGFICQSGDVVNNNGTGGRSIHGSFFQDESFLRRHAQAGVLSMANRGKNTNASQFFITLRKAPQLDGRHVVFGQVVGGMEIIRAIEKCPIDSNNVPRVPIVIENCGVLDKVPKRNLPINQLRDSVQKLMADLDEQSKPVELNLLEKHAKKLIESKPVEPSSIELLEAQDSGSKIDDNLEEFEKLEYKTLVEVAESFINEKASKEITKPLENNDSIKVAFGEIRIPKETETSFFNIPMKSPRKNVLKNLLAEVYDDSGNEEEIEENDDEKSKSFATAQSVTSSRQTSDNYQAVEKETFQFPDSDSESCYETASSGSLDPPNSTEPEDTRKSKLESLHTLLNESRNLNAKEVASEVKNNIKPQKNDSENKSEKKKYNKEAWNMNTSAYEIEAWDEVKKKQRNAEKSFGWNAFTDDAFYRAHKKRTFGLELDPENYAKQIIVLGEKFYDPTAVLVSAEFKPSEQAKDRLALALEKEKQKKHSFRRRRMYIEEENVQYINNFNRAFNEKLERAYGEQSLHIKQNLERGTAL